MFVDTMYETKCKETSDINEHLPILREYASLCEHVTEFGVRGIVSTWALLAAYPKTLISYDILPPSNWDGNIQQVYDAAMECGTAYIFHQQDVLTISIESTDLLFIDTLHVYDQLKNELALHASNVKKYIMCHDTTVFGINGFDQGNIILGKGIWTAIQEFLDIHPEWVLRVRYENNNGLTILERHEFS